MDQIKLKDLYRDCKILMEAGYGERFLVASRDNEGNGYHGMYYTLTPIKESEQDDFEEWMFDDCQETDLANMIIVG